MAENDWEAGRLVGFYNVGLLLGVSCGQYMFNGLRYRFCILTAMTSETLGVVIVCFLHVGVSNILMDFLFWIFGMVTSVTDSIVQCYLVDACDVTRTPTFCYAVFQSCYELGDTLGFTLYPQAKERLAWRDYWFCRARG
jgi:predicted MFS family arabinose efflux permease